MDYFSDRKIGRRDAIKQIAGTVAAAVSGLYGLSKVFDEPEKVSTEKIYTKNWKPVAEEIMKTIREYDEAGMQEELDSLYIDPVLQEYPYLKERGLIKNNEIEIGKYLLRIEDYKPPTILDNGKVSDIEVKVSVFDKERGDYIDLSPLPFARSKWIDLRTDNYNIKKILEK